MQSTVIPVGGREVEIEQMPSGSGVRFAIRSPTESPPAFRERLLALARQWCNDAPEGAEACAELKGSTVFVEVMGNNGWAESALPALESAIRDAGTAPARSQASGP